MRPLRIGFVLHVMQVAGAEVLTREIVRRLGNRIVPTLFCLDAVGSIGESMRRDGIDLVCFDRKPGRDWRVSLRMVRAIRKRRLDLLHAHQYSPFFYAALAKALCLGRPKLILTEHGRHFPDLVSPRRRAVNRLVLDHLADAVTACCRFSADGLRKRDGFAGARIEIIENGIDVDRYFPAPRKSEARRTILHVARHHPVKDQATLLRGFALVANDLNDVDLVMVGDGPLRDDLEEMARELRLQHRIRFLGIRSDISQLMQQADVFALTSLSEAASLTLLEAMASARPVVVTDVGGNGEIVRHEREGLLIPRGNAAACAAAFRQLFNNPKWACSLGEAGRRRVEEHYRLERSVERYFELYRRVVGIRTNGNSARSNVYKCPPCD